MANTISDTVFLRVLGTFVPRLVTRRPLRVVGVDGPEAQLPITGEHALLPCGCHLAVRPRAPQIEGQPSDYYFACDLTPLPHSGFGYP